MTSYRENNNMVNAKRSKLEQESRFNHHNHGGGGHHGGGGGHYGNERDDGNGGGRRKREESERLNHILLFTVLNPMYPITTDVLHTISSSHGSVLRIVVFKKHGVQAMVEFDSIESAKRAKENLHGADIYSGCCTLKIDFAKPSKLNVYKNDMDSWDYTNPNLSSREGRSGPLLQEPRYGSAPVPFRGGMAMEPIMPARQPPPFMGSQYDRYDNGYMRHGPMPVPGLSKPNPGFHEQPQYDRYPPDRSYMSAPPNDDYTYRNGPIRVPTPSLGGPEMVPPSAVVAGGVSSNRPMQQGAVMMVYGLCADKMNADRLFNIFCLYGNVVRVKFLKSKEECAMVQMGDALSVDRSISNFNSTYMFGLKVQLGYSKQAFLSDVQQPHLLPDGNPSFKDFMGNKNNRFLNPDMAQKNRIQPPAKTLHFFNTPPNIDEQAMKDVFFSGGSPVPKAVKFFQSKSDRSSSGLIEFEVLSEAVESLAIMNHHPIKNPGGKFPFIMKLCFSSSRNPQSRNEEK